VAPEGVVAVARPRARVLPQLARAAPEAEAVEPIAPASGLAVARRVAALPRGPVALVPV
jgi:hypothetical protein